MCYKCDKINLNCGGSYLDSPYWIKDKKATINAINKKDNRRFQNGVTLSLNHLPRITKIKPYIIQLKTNNLCISKRWLEKIWEK